MNRKKIDINIVLNDIANQDEHMEAIGYFQAGNLILAKKKCENILQKETNNLNIWILLSSIERELGNQIKSIEYLEKILKISPNNAEMQNNLGNYKCELKKYNEAIENYNKAIEIEPNYSEAYINKGATLAELKKYNEAIACYGTAIKLNPKIAQAYGNRANLYNQLKQYENAIKDYNKAIELDPKFFEAYSNIGNTYNELKQYDKAIKYEEKAIEINPNYANAYGNLGNSMYGLRQYEKAISSYDKLIKINPKIAPVYNNKGNALNELKLKIDAIKSYNKAIEIERNFADAWYNKGIALCDLKEYKSGIECFEKTIEIESNFKFLQGLYLHTKMQLCDWTDLNSQITEILKKIRIGEKVTPSFPVLSFTSQQSIQLKAAKIWINEKYPLSEKLGDFSKKYNHKKIRIAYFSADFKNHPVAHLTKQIFENHSREKFEIYAFSFGHDKKDEMRIKLEKVFDNFFDVKSMSDEDIARLSRRMEIDIAIDLGGLTADARTGIFAMRAAPTQVNYIGYPGTMGANYIDYIIADKFLIPEKTRKYYSEKIAYLPFFQPNDSNRKIPDKIFTRKELSLPNKGVIFACFNNTYKYNLKIFESWVKILSMVNGSVLFIYSDNDITNSNLKYIAKIHGLSLNRIIFGKRLAMNDYMARFKIADLFLDTYPFNGGTTVSDALWAGLPVLTRAGEAFSSRMATSMLQAINLPELITETQSEYEAAAIKLGNNPGILKTLREKIATNRKSSILFNTKLYTQHLEAAYTQMYQRHHSGLVPDHIIVSDESQYKTRIQSLKMKTFLHVGCGQKHKNQTTAAFNSPDWEELRLDIDASVLPDVLGTMTDMQSVASNSVDAVFSSHNIEHLYPHEVPVALTEFIRVLKPNGFVVITCPDLQSVCELVAQDKLTEAAYTSAAGPIAPLDILYGHRPAMSHGNLYMAHRCGFTQKVLASTVQSAGFSKTATMRRGAPFFDLWIAAIKSDLPDDKVLELAAEHFPK